MEPHGAVHTIAMSQTQFITYLSEAASVRSLDLLVADLAYILWLGLWSIRILGS